MTGTLQDPYEDIKRPICGEFVEIGQPTFAELIWAREVITRATSGPNPDVGTALRILAYGKSPVELPEMRKPGVFQAITQQTLDAQIAAAKYAITSEGAQAYQEKVVGLGMAKASVDFNKMIINDPEVVPLSGFASPQADNCAMISGNNAPIINPANCPKSDCNIDAVFSIDNSGSMGQSITKVQTGIAAMANLITTVSNGSYRFALQTFGQAENRGGVITRLDLTNQPCQNLVAFQAAAAQMDLDGGYEPWDQALTSIAYNWFNEWTYREDSDARILFIITDEAPIDIEAARTAADEMNRCGVRLAIIWTSHLLGSKQIEWFNDLTTRTNGFWVHAQAGNNILALMTSFILSVCESSQTPECPGGEDKILNGKFETSIANWTDLSTVSGRSTSWNSGFQALQTNGAAGQTISGLTPGDLAILGFSVHVDTTPAAAAAAAAIAPQAAPSCPSGWSLVDADDWSEGNTSLQGWAGSGVEISTSTLKLISSNETGGSGSFTDKLFMTAGDKIKTSDLDGSNLADVVTGSGNARDIDVDVINKHIYWMEISQFAGTEDAIYRVNIDGSNKAKIADIDESLGIRLDVVNQHIYYGTSITPQILRINFDGSGSTVIANSPKRVVRITLDIENDHVYWTGSNSSTDGTVYRSNLDGSNIVIIVDESTQPTIANVRGIGIDYNSGKLYASTTGELIQMDLDGSNYSVIGTTATGDDLIVDTAAGRICLADSGKNTVFTYELDGDNRNQLFPDFTANFTGIARMSANSMSAYKTFTDLTPGDDVQLLVNVDTVSLGQVAIQLLDGPLILAETINGSGTFSVIATVPISEQISACVRLIADPEEMATAGIFATSLCIGDDIPPVESILNYKLRNGSGSTLASGTVTEAELQPPGQDNSQRFDLFTTIGLDGEIEVFFDAETGEDSPFYVDNVLLCILKEDDCGPGTRNLISNPNFETGVQFWDDAADIPITPTDDEDVWDSLLNAIIVSLTGEPEVRTTLIDLKPGNNYSLNFELTSLEPAVITTIELIYTIYSSTGAVIATSSVTAADTSPPERLQLDFVAPADGEVTVSFKSGITSGVAKIRNILLCDTSGDCDPGFEKLSFDDFSENRGAWAGGTHDAVDQLVTLEATNGDDTLSQTFTALEPGITAQLSFNVLNSPDGIGTFKIEFHSGDIIDQFTTDGTPGIKTFSSIVQDDKVTILIKNLAIFDANLDDILVCAQDAPPCDGSITDLEVLVEWDGIPRKPTNLFNAIVRYTIRDPDDPFSVSTSTHIATDEGVLGVSSCDMWKQQGQGGTPQSGVLGFGLTPSLADSIAKGDFASVATRTNWIWDIPSASTSSGVQDVLSIAFQDPPAGLIENVEVFLLANHVLPSGADSSPENPGPFTCEPDPASELTISIRYKNSKSLQREFTQRIDKNDVWQQSDDFTLGLPWDTVSALDNGLKGSSARWESFEFVLDDVDGRGLDQCTTALFFTAVGEGILTFPEFAFENNRGVFTDSCLAEILITDLSPGSAVNEVQSVVLPSPSGGTWTLTFDFGTVETTTNIPWNASAEQVRNRLASLANIGDKANVGVTGSGTTANPFLITFVGTLGARDHNILVGNGDNFTGSATAFVTTVTNGTINEQQTISRNNDTVLADLLISFGGQTTTPLAFNRTLNEAQSALEGLTSIGAGNISVTGDTTGRDDAYTGPLRIKFIGSFGGQNVELATVSPSSLYTVTQDWMGGAPPAGGIDENQLITVQASGGTFVLRIFDVGGTAPGIEVDTTTEGGISDTDCYDITFSGTLGSTNIDNNTFFPGVPDTFTHTLQNIRQGGTDPEIQRHCFQWNGPVTGFGTPFGLTTPSDAVFVDILDTVAPSNLVTGTDSSAAIKTYLELASAVTVGDISVAAQQLTGAVNEVQTVTLTGSPVAGTFALIVEGERTADIPFNASATSVQNALNALVNLSEVTVTSSGTLPSNVTYTITFAGTDGSKNWQTIVADPSNLEGGNAFADTGAIPFNASATQVEAAIVAAASWLATTDIAVTKVSGSPVDEYQWNVFWTGSFTRTDIPQMQTDPSGSQLTGAPIEILEVTNGSGSNERQRLQIIRATGGSFKLSLTLDGVTDTTTAIPWNTTAEGLEAQLLQLVFFNTPGQISVVDEYPLGLPPDPINTSYIIVFQRIFGDIPLLVADFQETLLCNPLILPPIDPGPYPYPVPGCDDLSDLSCQSGPLLCRPGDSDEPVLEVDCCDNETITSEANVSRRLQIERDLFDPNRMVNGKRLTLRDLALVKGINVGEYTPYERNFNTGTLEETTWSRTIETKLSFVLIENNLDSLKGRSRVLNHISQHREILPARFTWPEASFT